MRKIFDTQYFDVVIAPALMPLPDTAGADEILVYAIVNKDTGVRENETHSYLDAVTVATHMSDALGEWFKEQEAPALASVPTLSTH